jgi:hypothetical protein
VVAIHHLQRHEQEIGIVAFTLDERVDGCERRAVLAQHRLRDRDAAPARAIVVPSPRRFRDEVERRLRIAGAEQRVNQHGIRAFAGADERHLPGRDRRLVAAVRGVHGAEVNAAPRKSEARFNARWNHADACAICFFSSAASPRMKASAGSSSAGAVTFEGGAANVRGF